MAGILTMFFLAFEDRRFSSIETSLLTGTGDVLPRLYTLSWAGPRFLPPPGTPVLFSAVSSAPKHPLTTSSMYVKSLQLRFYFIFISYLIWKVLKIGCAIID